MLDVKKLYLLFRRNSEKYPFIYSLQKKSIQDTSPSSSHEKPIKKDEDPSDWLGLKSDPEIDQNENEKYNPSTIKTHHLLSKTNSRDGDFYTSTLDVKDNLRENYGTDIISRKPLSTTLVEDLSPRAHLSGQRRGGGGTPESKKTSTILNSFMSDFGMFLNMLCYVLLARYQTLCMT